ncbi:divergent polysaccharide deacetylase family protein [Vannielia litorea]|uniref:Uncharacterized conserved protein YibQ, putative polysaccharide deacetylase 2 family n=1 Tax=Vannielia litorea TaxID=1217970 RepID=A0A1N6FPZ3_9RHOB|nr:divergent polysaccharide deacetylase family protein [Vannielia litorea]SIN97357.1 Uncharacterized conserved protein YibQ, putative polysaccharide deacetylase 2 family [Vannielia litorea]
MGKGLLSGVAWGALVSVLGLGGASVLAPLPEDVAAVSAPGGLEAPRADAAPEAPEPAPSDTTGTTAESELTPPPGSEFARAGEDTEPAAPGAEAEPISPAAPEQPDVEVAEAPVPDTTPPAVPETAPEAVAAPVAPVVEETAPVIGGGDAAKVVAEAPGTAAQPEAGRTPETATVAPEVPRSTPEVVSAEAATAAPAESETVGAAPGAAAPVAAAEVAPGETAERTAPVQAAGAGERAPKVEAVAPSTGGEVAAVAEVEAAGRTEAPEVAAAPEAEVVTGTEPVAESAAVPESAESAVPEQVASVEPEAPRAEAPDVVEIVEPNPQAAPQPSPEAEAPVAETPSVPATEATGDAPEPTQPDRESPSMAAETPAAPEAERAEVERETELPADPSSPPSSVPITERQPRTGTGNGLPRRIVTAGESGGGFGKRVVPLTERNKPESRLPVIGASAEAEAEAPRLSALAANAAPFENAEGRPLVSVILFDVGDQGLDRAALTAINFPVTFAVDATDPGAAETAQRYRDAGFEVLIVPSGLPRGATPQDMETTLQSYIGQFPGAAGLLETGEEGISDDPALSRQLLAIAADTGHGLVFVDSGLNSAQRGAESAGLPSALVWKVIDAGGEDGAAIGRTLDRAAFRSGQEGAVVVMGHSFSQTVTGLLNWAAGPKGQSVALAPVSAVLMR